MRRSGCSAQNLEHHLELRAADLVARATGAPEVNVECGLAGKRPLKFECEEFIGDEIFEVELVKRDGRYLTEELRRASSRSDRPTKAAH